MLKKAGLLTVGVTAGLLAVAPIASAGEASVKGDNDKDNSRSEDHGKKWDKDDKDHGKKHKAKQSCDSNGGDAEARGAISESDTAAGNLLTQAPIGGASVGSILSCNSDVLNDNLSNNTLDLL